jgi:hypothetical protein
MWQEFTDKSWQFSIIEQRKQIARQLKMSPSLNTYLTTAVIEAYADAVELAIKETQLPPTTFPNTCPYTLAQLLEEDFYPQPE